MCSLYKQELLYNSYVWDISVDKALVKTAQIMIGQAAGSELQNKLMKLTSVV